MLDFRPTVQVCNSFRQGYCKYGGSCRFLHVFQMQNGDCMVLNPPATSSCGSLKQLEMELIELLRSTRGIPVSLSSLPILYFDRFGKVLQETENHGHGRLSSRMIKLLARMTPNTIRLTNRPHRRQSIILDEDMDRYARFRVENGRQLQVYLTFPPESIFSEQDVHNYFNNFGAVQDVRIPSQVHRMFGFVSFAYPETAALVLTITNPHNICGSQVLVKPYQFKPMLLHRDHEEEVHDQEDAESPSKIFLTFLFHVFKNY
ncbi:zinc finger CCCH domain-containing protein 18 [Salvia miltiorrhiza]|uniref:zinc finger CCCH domain-containing protein 18 n=1 Tax=Salvia miltiorrhiza TaxID=226208 RepID=UPI0025AC55E6|nr:zinc finger CCCH domain-containing protein 18 [Salvia miltiorrhiza]